MVKINPNKTMRESIKAAIKENGGYCPCQIPITEDTKCPCKNFREQTEEGYCECGLFKRVNDEN